MISRLSLILVLALSTFSLCARPQLRSDVIFRPSQLINILADQLTFIIPRQKFDYFFYPVLQMKEVHPFFFQPLKRFTKEKYALWEKNYNTEEK